MKKIIFISLSAIVVLHLLSSLPGLYGTVKGLKNARRVSFLNDVSDDLFTAVGNYGFERGRVNVVLNDAGPVQAMEKNRQFILERRIEGDTALSQALRKLSGADVPGLEEKVLRVNTIQSQIHELRQRTGKDLLVTKANRETGLAETWFSAMTTYIEGIEALLVTISIDISNADGVVSRYSSLKHEALSLRNTAGPEMSILSATILSGQPIKQQLQYKIESLHTITELHFQNIAFLCQGLSTSTIPDALNALKKVYFSEYLPYREKIVPLVQTGGPRGWNVKDVHRLKWYLRIDTVL